MKNLNDQSSIYELTKTPQQRENIKSLSDKDKLEMIYQLTNADNIIDLLEYIEVAREDREYCNSYR